MPIDSLADVLEKELHEVRLGLGELFPLVSEAPYSRGSRKLSNSIQQFVDTMREIDLMIREAMVDIDMPDEDTEISAIAGKEKLFFEGAESQNSELPEIDHALFLRGLLLEGHHRLGHLEVAYLCSRELQYDSASQCLEKVISKQSAALSSIELAWRAGIGQAAVYPFSSAEEFHRDYEFAPTPR